MTLAPRRSRRWMLPSLLALCALLCAGPLAGTAPAKKKNRVDVTQAGGAIPAADPSGAPGVGVFTTTVGKKFKGKKIRDVNVTVALTGAPPPSPLAPLGLLLTAPNGTSTTLVYPGNLSEATASTITFDDNTFVDDFNTAPGDGDETALLSPYNGTVQPQGKALSTMDNGGVRGTWTLTAIYFEDPPDTASLVNWRLVVKAGKAYKTKGGK